MARDINKRLSQLENRRRGLDRLGRIALDEQIDLLKKSYSPESWQKRATDKSHTRYALGAMQEVGPDYTRISIETANRVANQLQNGLAGANIAADFRLQGSVPLNVHIRGVSDVDLLTLEIGFMTYAAAGALSLTGGHYSNVPTPRTSVGVLLNLRTESEKILKAKFPAATVDTSGGKAINISGGSLARPVDVVPSHWYDGHEYQVSRQETDRAVTILDKKKMATIDNWPFLHIKRVTVKCDKTNGALRKAIRLCKNVKADAIEEGTKIALPSFDLAALLYHANETELWLGSLYELRILSEAQRWLDHLYHNPKIAMSLRTPDGSRLIFDDPSKYEGMKVLSYELDDLLRQVSREQAPSLQADASYEERRRVLEMLTPD